MLDWFKKEKPFSGFAGFGGGASGLSGAGSQTPGITASGGIINDYSDSGNLYRAHIFTSSGTFDVTAPGSFGDNVEYLVIAGGGGGGLGGGGAG